MDDLRQMHNTRSAGARNVRDTNRSDVLGWTKRISSTTKSLVLLLCMLCLAGAIIIARDENIWVEGERKHWQWLDFLFLLSFVKVGISIVKYIPQVKKI